LDKNPFEKDKAQCILCQHNIEPNYKNVKLLSQFQSPYTGRIYGRHITGLCKKKHELVEKEISKSQSAGFMGTYVKSVEFFKDPKLFDPERPMRPHKY
jgi:small subunit ribosomal protein S18